MFFQEEEGKVLAFYTKGEEVVAVLTLGRDPLAARYKVLQSSLDMIFRFANIACNLWPDGNIAILLCCCPLLSILQVAVPLNKFDPLP